MPCSSWRVASRGTSASSGPNARTRAALKQSISVKIVGADRDFVCSWAYRVNVSQCDQGSKRHSQELDIMSNKGKYCCNVTSDIIHVIWSYVRCDIAFICQPAYDDICMHTDIGQAEVKNPHKMPIDTTSAFNVQHEYWFMPEGVTTSAFCILQNEYWCMPEGVTHLQMP